MQIGQYDIVKTIGRGGMGAVYVARDSAIDRLVAIKLLRDGIDSPEVRERFKREARSAGKLRHPNIVTIFHVGDHENRPYIVMEYIPGETLAEIIKQQTPMTIGRKLRIIEEICRGLAYAHKAGIVHRDIKPLNIMVDPEGAVKILDFGIARVGEQGLTQLGMMMGTPNYMSPEQISPGRADTRSDVFAVGLVLYEVLAYRRAFPGDDFSVLQKILQTEPEPVEKYCPNIDPELLQVLKRALAKKPDDRYQDLATMRQDITRILQRLRTPEDEASGEVPALTPPEAPYDGPTLVPGPNEQPPASQEQQRASELARELTRVADEKRRADLMAQTPPMGTPAVQAQPPANPAAEPTLFQPKLDMKAIEEARAEQRRKAGESADAAEKAKRAEEARRQEKATSDAGKTPGSQAADPTRTGPKKAPVIHASTSEPTAYIPREAFPSKTQPGQGARPATTPATADKPAAPPPPPPPPKDVAPPLPKPPSAATTQGVATKAPAADARNTSRKPGGMPPWLIPAAAGALILLLIGLRMLLGGGGATPDSGTTPPTQGSTAPAETAPQQATPQPPAADASSEVAARISAAMAAGDLEGALRELQGLANANDPAMAGVVSAVTGATRSAAQGAFDSAEAAGAGRTPSDAYKNGLTQRDAADAAAAAGRMPEAAQGYLNASRSFRDAAEAARTTTAPQASVPQTSAPTAVPAPPPQQPPARRQADRPQPSHAADVASIQTLLEQYADAYAKMDVNALRAVWPSTSPTLSFAGNKSYTMSLRNPQLQVNGDVATVAAVRHTVQELENGQKREASVPITMNLRRISGGWVIDTIQ